MISLISIEGREDEAQAWIAEFALSGQRLGTELTRLYPPNKKKENKPAHPTAGNATD
jgi:hypothetical protein